MTYFSKVLIGWSRAKQVSLIFVNFKRVLCTGSTHSFKNIENVDDKKQTRKGESEWTGEPPPPLARPFYCSGELNFL
jgi:hypothetical protein